MPPTHRVLSVFYREVARQVRLEDRLDALQQRMEEPGRGARPAAADREEAGALG